MSKIKENIKLYKREVIVSLVTMIIISVGKILFRYIKDGGRHFLNIFSDLIYYEMGRISDFSIIYSFCGFCIAVFLGTLLIISIELIFGRDNSVQKKNNFKVPRKVLGIEMIVLVILFSVFSISSGYCISQKHRFDLKMTALKPYITENEYNKLYSSWVSMFSKEDYKNIHKELLELKCKYVIKDEKIKKYICD